jgi:hypothetical protein
VVELEAAVGWCLDGCKGINSMGEMPESPSS